ncbi:MAG: iron chaperone [Opitutales bacterium]
MAQPRTVDEYIAAAPAGVRPVLASIRATVRRAAPGAEERLSYRMPAYFLGGMLVCFAAFKRHIGFYPPMRDEKLKPLVARYAGPKGNLRFLLAEPMPLALIAKIVRARIKESRRRQAAARKA